MNYLRFPYETVKFSARSKRSKMWERCSGGMSSPVSVRLVKVPESEYPFCQTWLLPYCFHAGTIPPCVKRDIDCLIERTRIRSWRVCMSAADMASR